MAEAPSNTHNKRSLIRTSHLCHRRRAAGRNQQGEEYKHTHTHTYEAREAQEHAGCKTREAREHVGHEAREAGEHREHEAREARQHVRHEAMGHESKQSTRHIAQDST